MSNMGISTDNLGNSRGPSRKAPTLSDANPLPWPLLSVEALGSAGTNLLVSAIYFYTSNRFHWTLRQNFLLAAGQGIVYVIGALSAGKIVSRIDKRVALGLIYTTMALLSLVALSVGPLVIAFTAIMLAYNCVSSMGWPILESLVSGDADAHSLSRRIAIYNIVWSTVAGLMLAIDGTLIEHWAAGVFLIPAIAHGLSAAAMFRMAGRPERSNLKSQTSNLNGFGREAGANSEISIPAAESSALHSIAAEPELLRVRTLALWLSRVALPATYVAIFSLMALMPSLPSMKNLDPAHQTLLGCTWMVSRSLTFLVLGLGTWWHTRPRLLLVAAIVMFFSFLGVTVRCSDFVDGFAAADVFIMIGAQICLGVALGMIYAGSLYFGMALSEGSTEHGGYHEALIGVGFVVGPGTGAIAETLHPHSVYTAIASVASVVFLSVIAVAAAALLVNKERG